jgi:hypothetical protein
MRPVCCIGGKSSYSMKVLPEKHYEEMRKEAVFLLENLTQDFMWISDEITFS